VKTQGPSANTAASASRAFSQPGKEVIVYLVASPAQEEEIRRAEELAQWVRHDSGVMQPDRDLMFLKASTPADEAEAQDIINDMMAASNFVSTTPPTFSIIDMRSR
jgi:hypothetical protein